MIKEFVDKWYENKDAIEKKLREEFNDYYSYKSLVEIVLGIVGEDILDVEKIHEIDGGGYQGILFYIIPEKAYSAEKFYYVCVEYGSCSVCDTLQGIEYEEDKKQQIEDLMTLALHIVQNIKVINAD